MAVGIGSPVTQLRGVTVTRHTPLRLRSPSSLCADTICSPPATISSVHIVPNANFKNVCFIFFSFKLLNFGAFLLDLLPMRVIISGRNKKSPSVLPEILWIFLNVMLSPTESIVYEFESFRIDAGKRLLWNGGGEPIPLTPKVFDTLFYLVNNAGKVIEKDELMSA